VAKKSKKLVTPQSVPAMMQLMQSATANAAKSAADINDKVAAGTSRTPAGLAASRTARAGDLVQFFDSVSKTRVVGKVVHVGQNIAQVVMPDGTTRSMNPLMMRLLRGDEAAKAGHTFSQAIAPKSTSAAKVASSTPKKLAPVAGDSPEMQAAVAAVMGKEAPATKPQVKPKGKDMPLPKRKRPPTGGAGAAGAGGEEMGGLMALLPMLMGGVGGSGETSMTPGDVIGGGVPSMGDVAGAGMAGAARRPYTTPGLTDAGMAATSGTPRSAAQVAEAMNASKGLKASTLPEEGFFAKLLGKGGKGKLAGAGIGIMLGLLLGQFFSKMYAQPQQMQTEGDLNLAAQGPADLAVQQAMLPRQGQQNDMLRQAMFAQMMGGGGGGQSLTTSREQLM
jgi:hypothetical protein